MVSESRVVKTQNEEAGKTLNRLIEKIFLPGGLLSNHFPTYKFREDQMQMSQVIAKAILSNKAGIIEAGTGTGKSFAECFPVVLHCILQGKRAVICTHTIALQQQLYLKDIPLVQKVLQDLGMNFKAVQIKGKSNYVCLRRLSGIIKNPPAQDKDELNLLLRHVTTPEGKIIVGDKEKLPYKPAINFWGKICGDQEESCEGCPHREGACFYNHLRKSAKSADVIITNHYVVMANLLAREKAGFTPDSGLLPDYDILVIDEAHHIEDVASEFMGRSISARQVTQVLFRIRDLFGRNGALNSYNQDIKMQIFDCCDRVENEIRLIFQNVSHELDQRKKEAIFWEKGVPGEYSSLLKLEALLLSVQIRVAKDELKRPLNVILSKLTKLRDELNFFSEEESNDEFAYWVSRDKELRIKATPISLGKIFRKSIFEKTPTILTSATIQFNKGLSFFAKRIGKLEEHEYESAFLLSPFNYKDKVCLYIPSNAQDPSWNTYDEYCQEEMLELVRASKGRAFLLFTATRTLEEYYAILAPKIEALGYLPLKQGQLERTQLVEKFKEHKNAVLFGADSFWEGIDVPGRELSLVVIQKLPFSVPSPVTEARRVEIKKSGGDDFLEGLVFSAVTKFKQGFGRLIRHEKDKGVFCVLDGRILSQKEKYGKFFLKSLPETQRTVFREDLAPFFD